MSYKTNGLILAVAIIGTIGAHLAYKKYEVISNYSDEHYPACVSEDGKVTTTPTLIEKINFYYGEDNHYARNIVFKSRVDAIIDDRTTDTIKKSMVHFQRGRIETKLSGYSFSYFDKLNTDPIKEVCKYGYSVRRVLGINRPEYGSYSIRCVTNDTGRYFTQEYRTGLPLYIPELIAFSSGGFRYNFCPSNISKISDKPDQSKVIAFEYAEKSVRDIMTKESFIEGLNADIVILAKEIKETIDNDKAHLKTLLNNRKSWQD